MTFPKLRFLGCLAWAFLLSGCGLSNQIMPLHGEDPAALAYSEDRHDWLEQTGATRALTRLRAAVRSGDTATVLNLLGPSSRAIVRARAADAGQAPTDLLKAGNVPGLGLPDQAAPLAVLAADGALKVQETGAFDPSRREVRLAVQVGEGDVFHVPAVFVDDAWRLELVGRVAVGGAVGGGRE
jgi:hypothetical protein